MKHFTLDRNLAATFLLLALGGPVFAADKVWKVVIVTDVIREEYAQKASDGFRKTLDGLLAARNESAAYTSFDTELSEAKAADIVRSIKALGPDLIFTVNHPTAFADIHVAGPLKDPRYRFVSENAVPVQSGAAATWDRPGGNITGVGVFIRFNSQIKLLRMIRPEASKLVMFSWDATTLVNDYYEKEVRRACAEEGVSLVAFQLVHSAESQLVFMDQYAAKGPEYFIGGVISAWVHDDGTPADMTKIEGLYIKTKLKIPYVSYDEVSVQAGAVCGACVIWGDLGAQIAEKGLKILDGAHPGDLPWDYPRKYNIVLNQAAAKRLGIQFPQALINAAYRVYIDDNGHYAGQGN